MAQSKSRSREILKIDINGATYSVSRKGEESSSDLYSLSETLRIMADKKYAEEKARGVK
jgi:hypothetical protein